MGYKIKICAICDQVLYWGNYRVVELVMDFEAREAVFYIV